MLTLELHIWISQLLSKIQRRVYLDTSYPICDFSSILCIFRAQQCLHILIVHVLHLSYNLNVLIIFITVFYHCFAGGAIALLPRLISRFTVSKGRESNSAAWFQWSKIREIQLC